MNTRNAPPDPSVELCGQSPVTSLTFVPAEVQQMCHTLFSGHQNGKIIEWNLETHRAISSWQGHRESVLWLSWTMSKLFSQGRDGVVRIWSHKDPTHPVILGEIHSAELLFCNSSLCKREDNYYLATPSDKTAEVNIHLLRESAISALSSQGISLERSFTELSTAEKTLSTFCHSLKPTPVQQYATCMKMCSFCTSVQTLRLLVAYESGSLILWDLVQGTLLNEVKAHDESVMCVNIWANCDSSKVKCVTGSVDCTLKSWLILEDKISPLTTVSVTNPGFSDIAVREDGKILATSGWDSMGRVFSLSKLRPLAVLTYHRATVQCISFASDKTLATGSKDGYIALWKLYMKT